MTINPGVIAHPDVVFFVPLQSCLVEHFCAMFDKSVLDKGIAVDLRLMKNTRGANGGSLINLQDFVAIGGQTAGGNHLTVRQETRLVGEATVTAHQTMINRDVVTYLRVMANVRGMNACPSADGGLVADHAGPG